MDSTVTGKAYLDQILAGLTALISSGLETLSGPGVNATVFGNVTRADLGTAMCLVLFVLLVHCLGAAFLRHKHRQAAAMEDKELRRHFFGVLGKPTQSTTERVSRRTVTRFAALESRCARRPVQSETVQEQRRTICYPFDDLAPLALAHGQTRHPNRKTRLPLTRRTFNP